MLSGRLGETNNRLGRGRGRGAPALCPAMRRKGREHPLAGPHCALAILADRQHGVVSIRQLTGPLGYSSSAVDRAVRAGRLHRLYREVFAVGHVNLSLHGHCLASILACGPGALLSHISAAWLWDLTKASPLPASVSVPRYRKPRPPLRLHEARSLASEDRALREGIPVTSLPRTLLDLAATVRFEWLEKMVERSEDLELIDPGRRRSVRSDPPLRRGTRRLLDARLAGGVRAGPQAAGGLLLQGIGMTRVTGPRLEREPQEVIRRIARPLEQRGLNRSIA